MSNYFSHKPLSLEAYLLEGITVADASKRGARSLHVLDSQFIKFWDTSGPGVNLPSTWTVHGMDVNTSP